MNPYNSFALVSSLDVSKLREVIAYYEQHCPTVGPDDWHPWLDTLTRAKDCFNAIADYIGKRDEHQRAIDKDLEDRFGSQEIPF